MAFTSPMTAVTGATFTAAQFNTHVRDNLNAIWVGTTAGDIDYYSSATVKARLAAPASLSLLQHNGTAPSWLVKGDALKFLRVSSGSTAFEWAGGGVKFYSHFAAPDSTYGASIWRDIPSSSKSVTVDIVSTLLCIGWLTREATDVDVRGEIETLFNIDGTDSTFGQPYITYGAGIRSISMIGAKESVAAGARTVKIREYCAAGSYTLRRLAYAVLIIPQ